MNQLNRRFGLALFSKSGRGSESETAGIFIGMDVEEEIRFVLLFWYHNERHWTIQNTSSIVKPRKDAEDYREGNFVIAKFSGQRYKAVVIRTHGKKEGLEEDATNLEEHLKNASLSPKDIIEKMGVTVEERDLPLLQTNGTNDPIIQQPENEPENVKDAQKSKTDEKSLSKSKKKQVKKVKNKENKVKNKENKVKNKENKVQNKENKSEGKIKKSEKDVSKDLKRKKKSAEIEASKILTKKILTTALRRSILSNQAKISNKNMDKASDKTFTSSFVPDSAQISTDFIVPNSAQISTDLNTASSAMNNTTTNETPSTTCSNNQMIQHQTCPIQPAIYGQYPFHNTFLNFPANYGSPSLNFTPGTSNQSSTHTVRMNQFNTYNIPDESSDMNTVSEGLKNTINYLHEANDTLNSGESTYDNSENDIHAECNCQIKYLEEKIKRLESENVSHTDCSRQIEVLKEKIIFLESSLMKEFMDKLTSKAQGYPGFDVQQRNDVSCSSVSSIDDISPDQEESFSAPETGMCLVEGRSLKIKKTQLDAVKRKSNTATSLVRHLLLVFFSNQELAESCARGSKTRKSLDKEILSTIIAYVLSVYPQATERNLVQAINGKCSDLRLTLKLQSSNS